MNRRKLLRAAGLGLVTTAIAKPAIAHAQGPIKIGLIQSMTGPFNDTGKAVVNGAQLYVRQSGDIVAGRRIQLIVRDDATAPDQAKRVAQEMIVNDKVAVIGRHHAIRTDHRTTGDRGEGRHCRDAFGSLDHGRAFALHGADQFHARSIVRRNGGLACAERGAQDRHPGQ